MRYLIILTFLLIPTFFARANTYFLNYPFIEKSIQLPALDLNPNKVTVSGLSSGAFMAVQLGVAYSSVFQGVAAVAGGIYGCAEGQVKIAQDLCMKDPEKIEVNKYVNRATDYFNNGLIDDPKNIRDQKVFILAGSEDKTILPKASKKLEEFYTKLGVQSESEYSLKMGHGFPSEKGKVTCADSIFPWINNCGYNGAQHILEALYGKLDSPKGTASLAPVAFDQTEFASKDATMLDYGYIYIPKSCEEKKGHCRLHVALHGCLQDPSIANQNFIQETGYNEWANANNIVVLYPSAKIGIGNPSGCWDWFGYTGADYETKSAKQMITIMRMINRLLSN